MTLQFPTHTRTGMFPADEPPAEVTLDDHIYDASQLPPGPARENALFGYATNPECAIYQKIRAAGLMDWDPRREKVLFDVASDRSVYISYRRYAAEEMTSVENLERLAAQLESPEELEAQKGVQYPEKFLRALEKFKMVVNERAGIFRSVRWTAFTEQRKLAEDFSR